MAEHPFEISVILVLAMTYLPEPPAIPPISSGLAGQQRAPWSAPSVTGAHLKPQVNTSQLSRKEKTLAA